MKIYPLSALGAVLLLSVTSGGGCKREAKEPLTETAQRATPQEAAAVLTFSTELAQKLQPGMNTNAIISELGRPESMETLNASAHLWRYRIQPFLKSKSGDGSYSTYAVGLNMRITNGHLGYWGFVSARLPTTGISKTEIELGSVSNLVIWPELEFYIVSPKATPGSTFVDMEGLPRLGFIPSSPTLTIRTVKELTLLERTQVNAKKETNRHWLVTIDLADEEAIKFGAITRTNLGKKLLIMLDKSPVSCATIILPIESGRFEMECLDTNSLQSVRKLMLLRKSEAGSTRSLMLMYFAETKRAMTLEFGVSCPSFASSAKSKERLVRAIGVGSKI